MNRLLVKDNKEIEDMMASYYSYIGASHIENELKFIEDKQMEIEMISIPDTMDVRFDDYIRRLKGEEAKELFKKKSKRFAMSAAIFLLIVITSLSILTVSVEAFRTKLYNFFVEKNETHTTVKIEEEASVLVEDIWVNSYWLTEIPSGYELSSKDIFNETKLQLYTNDKNELITFAQGEIGSVFQLDTESAEMQAVMINGYKGMVANKSEMNIVFWSNEETSFYITARLDVVTLIKIAEKIENK